MKKSIARKKGKPSGRSTTRRPATRVTKKPTGSLLAPVRGAERRNIGHVTLEVGRAGSGRVKRMVYPPGFRWSTDMKAIVGTTLCMHAHIGFLTQGEIHIEYADGCVLQFKAPQVVAIDPGHDGWVVGKEQAVLIEFDFESETARRFGMPDTHRHA